jgi:hypothetical protein
MSPRYLSATGIAGLILVCAWSGLACGLTVALSAASGPARVSLSKHRSWTIPISAMGTDPCTGELVEVEATLTIDMWRPGILGTSSADVDLNLESATADDSIELVDRLVRHFTVYGTPITGMPDTPLLQSALVGRHRLLDLVVDLERGIDDRGEMRLSVSNPRIDTRRSPCGESPPFPPGQPITYWVRHPATV